MIHQEGFILELTGSDASAQNGVAESPNKYLGNMMRCLLHSAGLGPEYWLYALLHAVFIKNRLPHTFINKIPFEALTWTKPDLMNLRIFGSGIYAQNPGHRPAKFDHHTSNSNFLGYVATTKKLYYIDDATQHVKTSTHALFDEAHFTVNANEAPLVVQAL